MSTPAATPSGQTSAIPKLNNSRGVAPATEKQGNVFKTTDDAEKWAKARGLSPNLAPPMGDLVLRTMRYGHSSGERLQHFNTVGLFTRGAISRLPQTETLEAVPTIPERAEARPLTGARCKEMGLFVCAAEKILPGTRILVERPSLLIPTVLWAGGLPMNKNKLLQQMFSQLSSEKQGTSLSQADQVRALSIAHNLTASAEEGILRTNGISVTLEGESRPYSGVFVQLSRCNHSCTPNAAVIWDPTIFSLVLIAATSIEPGTEITISYIDLLMSADDRMKQLNLTHSFTCRCPKCSLLGMERLSSDTNRLKLRTWARSSEKLTFRTWLRLTEDESTRKHTVPKLEKELQTLYEVIGSESLFSLKSLWMELADAVFRISYAKGETETKRRKLLKGPKMSWKLYEGFNADVMAAQLKMYESWISNPEACPDWKCREY